MTTLADANIWAMFEDHFAKAFPEATCAKVTVVFRTVDDEQATIGIIREGFSDWLADFDEDDLGEPTGTAKEGT